MALVEVGFRDLGFEYWLAWCRSPLEGRSQRWVPHGMPRLSPILSNAAFFIYRRDPKTGLIEGPVGTGVLIGVPRKHGLGYLRHLYAVTAHHVAPKDGSIIRVNTKDGESRLIELEPDQWQFEPKGDDVSAFDVTERVSVTTDEVSAIPANLLVSWEFIDEVELGIGEDGFMLGLFADLPGEN